MIAGTANHETSLAQCYNEFPAILSCGNVAPSADCPSSTGGVLGGRGDGECVEMKGGIGMFQLDKGTYSDTRSFYGDGILTVDGNIEAGVDFFITKLGFHCIYTPTFQSETGVINWLNAAKFGATEYDELLTGLAACYNGCEPGWNACGNGTQSHQDMKNLYDNAIHNLYNKFGDAYWYGNTPDICSSSTIFTGSGSNGQSGANCLAMYNYPVVAGQTYTISTCDNYSGDTYLKTMGACTCNPSGNDDACGGLGSQCTCTATSTGTATICASTFSSASASWNYQVTCGAPAQPPTCQNSGPFSGSGSNGQSGTNCLAIYSFPVISGNMYRISTCDSFSGDTY
ncbi:MAG TPA: hypothetical protein VLK22_02010, partial [Candidatus Udaeobacter sp.]|nr:hypothetical protein [Candidatus Udaeobacter sp.]